MHRPKKRKTRRFGSRLKLETLESRVMLHAAGALSGSVYFDADGDGTRGASEVGVPGVVIRLSDSSDSSDSSLARSAITDDDGIYTFNELEPATYQISKRQTSATIDGQDSTSVPGAVSSNNLVTNVVLADDQNQGGIDFAEQSLRPEYINIAWFFASSPPPSEMVRESIALSEELAGNPNLATSIRAGGNDVPDDTNNAPVAANDVFAVEENEVLNIAAASGVLVNDIDPDGGSLTATLVGQASNGVASINDDGSLTYTPDADFFGTDTFTYQASDGVATSSLATVTINVNRGNEIPVATDDVYTVEENGVLTVAVASGVLSNDSDLNGDTLIANLADPPANGSVTLNADGSFTYTPDDDFSGEDSFTYTANDGVATSNVGTVTITVTLAGLDQPFDPVIPGSIDEPGLLGTRMDTQPGAPPFTLGHTATAVDYSAFDNAPSYGQHHGFVPGITPRPTGVYETEQPDEDLVHNLEHGHVWISYNPSLVDTDDHLALEQLVRGGGTDTGVILTPRFNNTAPIVLTSLTRQLTLDNFDAATIRDFVNTNRGHSPEGFIRSGQKSDDGESLDDGLPHTP